MYPYHRRGGGRINRYLRILDLLGIGRRARGLQDAVELYVGGLDQLSANTQSVSCLANIIGIAVSPNPRDPRVDKSRGVLTSRHRGPEWTLALLSITVDRPRAIP